MRGHDTETERSMMSTELDDGECFDDVEVGLEENVYSFFQFIVPSEKKKEGKSITIDIMNAYFLVILCILMQLLALYAIFQSVVVQDFKWQGKIMVKGTQNWGLFAAAEECNDGSSLCSVQDGVYTCAPPSVQLTGRWDELDTDGDGFWSIEEAQQEADTLQCKYAVNSIEVFDVFKNIILQREDLIWVSPDLKAGKTIAKPYFDYLKGDVIMCGYASVDMCSNVLDSGFFDAPLKLNSSPRVGNTTESALKYCTKLLEQQGTCEELLPSTYTTWKIESVEQCGSPDYDRIVFTHPSTGKQKSMLSVDYDERKAYQKFQTPLFVFYKYIIIFIWGLVMMSEAKTVVNLWQWVINMPGVEAERKNTETSIAGIDRQHRVMNGFVGIVRMFVLLMLCYIGTLFLLKSGDYVDLLFDAVAVVFILEFGDILYAKAIRKNLQDQTSSMEPMKFKGTVFIDYLAYRPGLVDMLWLVGLFIVIAIIEGNYYKNTVIPVYHALQCTCLKVGEPCREAQAFNYDFWYDYWSKVVPGVLTQIDGMKAATMQATTGAVQTILHHRGVHHHHHHHALISH